jgi:hypothetical protein
MRQCYVGESFIQKFAVSFEDDTGQTVDSGDFEIWLDGELIQSGTLGIDTTGRILSFRFNPRTAGLMEIKLSWRVGDDVWRQPFLMKVVQP